jgi:hypothetical protein
MQILSEKILDVESLVLLGALGDLGERIFFGCNPTKTTL